MKKENAINFLLFGYFGITLKNSKDDIISAAINRAYRDAASHVLSLTDEYKKNTNEGQTLYVDASHDIEEFIEDVLTNGTQNKLNKNNYDDKHEKLCKKLIKLYHERTNSGYEFSYGVAQKWVNMTMKYLSVILTIFSECNNTPVFVNTYKNSFRAIEHFLHVPIDGYILEYVSKEKYIKEFSNVKPIEIAKNNSAWSKYNKSNYEDLQEKINEIPKSTKKSPLDWENEAWIKVAQNKKQLNK